jgi:osmoprotectant transport system permease protein
MSVLTPIRPDPAAPGSGGGQARANGWFRRLRSSDTSLVVMPVIIVAVAVVLYIYDTTSEKDFSTASALQRSKLQEQFVAHLTITLWASLLVVVIAVPLGIVLTRDRYRRYSGGVLAVANSGQAMPAYGLVVIFAAWLGTGMRTVILALAFFALLPVLRNTMVGLSQVGAPVIEAGRGMGMSRGQVLRRIELPLAVPVILAGVRTALVLTVGMAALAFLIGGGGLGETINSGLKLSRNQVVVTGATLVALLALSVDWVAAVAERVLRPRGI